MDDDKIINETIKQVRREMEFKIEKIPSPNFSNRSANAEIDTIIVHYTAANRIAGTISWFQMKESKVSAHYVIGRDGRIVQMVEDDKKAWHAGASFFRGKKNVNNFSIGIELVGTKDSGFTDVQYEACAYVCSKLIEKYKIELDRIVGHEDISGDEAVKLGIRTEKNKKIDPGLLWDWEKFHTCLSPYVDKSIADDEPKQPNDENYNKELYSPDPVMESGKDPEPESPIIQLIFAILRIFGVKL